MKEGAYYGLNVRGFIVDFFGALVPGLLFIFLSFFALGWPIWLFMTELQIFIASNATPPLELFKQIRELSTVLTVELSILLLVASYVIGTLFFRRDPKAPDHISYEQSSKKFDEDERKGWVVQKDESGKEDVQFPYRYLREYLSKRELTHLAAMIPWEGKDQATHLKRTKTFINMLKIRLEFYFPEKCGTLIKNEAQVRLMSSLWYITKTLLLFGSIGIFFIALSMFIGGPLMHDFPFDFLISLSVVIFVLVNSFLGKRMIQEFFHYQRVREIIYVLETAYIAAKEKPVILDGIISLLPSPQDTVSA